MRRAYPLTSQRRKARKSGTPKPRLPLPARGPQVHKDQRHEEKKYSARRGRKQLLEALEEISENEEES